jgi:ATP-dependent protease ClpP protease subunit
MGQPVARRRIQALVHAADWKMFEPAPRGAQAAGDRVSVREMHPQTRISTLGRGAALLLACLLPLACQRGQPAPAAHAAAVVTMGNQGDAPVVRDAAERPAPAPADYLSGTHWPPEQLAHGQAWISCSYDYAGDGDGQPVESLDFLALVDALTPCRDTGATGSSVVRLRYHGSIDPGFRALVERVGEIAARMAIDDRVLDMDSTGGQVEEAIRAGDSIAGAQWAIWVREGSICHSACVLVLAAGDTRSIEGKVGIHRLMRDGSRATTRRELAEELHEVTEQVRDYLARNGVAGSLADQMMIVPNRDLRVLTAAELAAFGLSGTNAVQDDLDRITLMRQCGEDFVRRRDAFMRAFDRQCMEPGETAEAKLACGQGLEQRYGFPDADCGGQSPMKYYARRDGETLPPPTSASVAAPGRTRHQRR